MKCALGYDMGPGARPVIHPVTAPRNQASEYLSSVFPHSLVCTSAMFVRAILLSVQQIEQSLEMLIRPLIFCS